LDISHPIPLIINPVHKLNLWIEIKLGVLVYVRGRVWVSVVIRKCVGLPLFIYLVMNSLTNATSFLATFPPIK